MFERLRNRETGGRAAAVEERPGGADGTRGDMPVRGGDGASIGDGTAVRQRPPALSPDGLRAVRARQRDEFGGVNWGAAFFGWLVAVGLGVLLVAVLVAAGAAVGLTTLTGAQARGSAAAMSLGGAVALVVVLMIAYFCGGYVAGRMSRFDGARQGAATWVIGVVLTGALALAGVLLGDQYNVLAALNLPSLPVGKATLAGGGVIALAAIVLGTLLAAAAGGKAGERYHRRIDRLALAT